MEIKRNGYLEKMLRRRNNGLVKIITGIRRCGKSYLMNTIFYNELVANGFDENHIIKFAFDSASDLALIGEDLIELRKKKKKVNPKKFLKYMGKVLTDDAEYILLLDEIQELDSFEAVLNGYLNKSNLDIYVSGSNAKFLSKDVVTEFAGRGDEIKMAPLTFQEFMSVYSGDKYEGLSEYMTYGGIPLTVLKKSREEKESFLAHLYEEIYLRDIYLRYDIRNKKEFEDLLNLLASYISCLVNPEKLKNTFRSASKSDITGATISHYLKYIEESFLVSSATRYDVKGKAYIETPKKYYFSDLGLRNARINFRQTEGSHLLENVIYNELISRGFDVDVGVVEVAIRDKQSVVRKQYEVDFVCNMGSTRYYIQSAYSISENEKLDQEIRPFKKINDFFKKIVITRDTIISHYDENGILYLNIFDFLLKRDSILL